MVKLPKHYYYERCYWAHQITLRCNAGCPYCILSGRGTRISQKEMSGKEILEWWNSLEHDATQKLSILGGEPTLHPDIVEVINGLKNYRITITTNCKSPFYEDPDFNKRFKVHPTSTLRINTSYHPHHVTPEEYMEVIRKWRESPYFVDQTAFVYTPDVMEKYGVEIEKVRRGIILKSPPFLGFYDEIERFEAPFNERNLQPNETFHNQKDVAEMCGLTDLDAYRHMCGQSTGMEAQCWHPRRSLIIGPNGNYYHCHYKMYYDIGPVCNVKDFKSVPNQAINCRHYGLCNWCDVPRVGCVKNKTAKPQVLSKLYDKREMESSEVNTLFTDIQNFAKEHSLECDESKWFEYAYSLLYSGHRIRGKTLVVGNDSTRLDNLEIVDAQSIFPRYLSSRGYNVTTVSVEDLEKFNPELENKFDLIVSLNTIGRINEDTKAVKNLARYLKPGGVMVISVNIADRLIDCPKLSRAYTSKTFEERIIIPLEEMRIERVGSTDFDNIDISNKKEMAVNEAYTFGISILRKKI